tara:strand:+ start:1327 stop:1581 length:255 start_codon:yes stop_codon:yes gene_type:complete
MKLFKKLLGLTGTILTCFISPSAKATLLFSSINILAGLAVKLTKSDKDNKALDKIRKYTKDLKDSVKKSTIEAKKPVDKTNKAL